MQPAGERAKKPSLKEIGKLFLSPPIIAVFVGLILYALRLSPPLFLDKAVQALGSTASVLGMPLGGMGMAGMGART